MAKRQGSTRWIAAGGIPLFVVLMIAAAVAQQDAPKGAPAPPAHELKGRLHQELKGFDNRARSRSSRELDIPVSSQISLRRMEGQIQL